MWAVGLTPCTSLMLLYPFLTNPLFVNRYGFLASPVDMEFSSGYLYVAEGNRFMDF